MPYNTSDPALGAVKAGIAAGADPQDAYYDVFKPNRNKTIDQGAYGDAVAGAVARLGSSFSRIQVQGDRWTDYATPVEAARAWKAGGGYDFLHIHKGDGAAFRVYIPADLRRIAAVIATVWQAPSLTGFKVAGYLDADNRSDVIVAWVKTKVGVEHIADSLPDDALHGMRPPGSDIVRMGCLVGVSREVLGSSVGTEVVRDLS